MEQVNRSIVFNSMFIALNEFLIYGTTMTFLIYVLTTNGSV